MKKGTSSRRKKKINVVNTRVQLKTKKGKNWRNQVTKGSGERQFYKEFAKSCRFSGNNQMYHKEMAKIPCVLEIETDKAKIP